MNPDATASRPFSRRSFVKGSAVAAASLALPQILPSRLFGQTAPSNQIGVALVGSGWMGSGHLDALVGFPEFRVRAVCDVDRWRRDAGAQKVNQAYGGKDCASVRDFREVCARPDIDAVFIATPDHWHALIAIAAIRAGKDVYVEKPLTLTLREGRALVQEARAYGRVVQTGTMQRSMKRFRDAAQFVRNEGLGKLQRIDVLIPENSKNAPGTWQPEIVPDGFDWDMWLGPSPVMPFNRHACHYNFRFNLDFALGQVTNWGTHYLDIAQWALGTDDTGPVELSGHGEFPTTGLFNTATHVDFTARYANGVLVRCHTRYDGESDGNIRFEGDKGWLSVNRSSTTASDPAMLHRLAPPDAHVKLVVSNNHHENFLQCIRTREKPVADVEIGHRSTSVPILGNIAMRLDRPLQWDPAKERFVGDEQANRLLGRAMRAPWTLV